MWWWVRGGGGGRDKGEVVESVGRKRAGKNFVGVYVGGEGD